MTGQPKFDLFQRFSANSYTLAKSWWQTLVKKPNFYVGHRENILYVFSTSDLPRELSDIFDQFLAPFVSENGGESINETPIAFSTSILAVSPLSYLLNRLKVDYSLQVKINPQVQKVEAATEEVRVPPGVSVTIKRSRTVKHSVEIKEVTTRGGALEAGIKLPSIDILKASIKTEVQKQSGSSWEESETIDYQVNLSGDKSPAYRLLWTDLMRVGTVEIHQSDQTSIFPFSCREATQMDISPIGPTA